MSLPSSLPDALSLFTPPPSDPNATRFATQWPTEGTAETLRTGLVQRVLLFPVAFFLHGARMSWLWLGAPFTSICTLGVVDVPWAPLPYSSPPHCPPPSRSSSEGVSAPPDMVSEGAAGTAGCLQLLQRARWGCHGPFECGKFWEAGTSVGDACPVQWAAAAPRPSGGLSPASPRRCGTGGVPPCATTAGNHWGVLTAPSYEWRRPPRRLIAAAADEGLTTNHS